MWAYVKKYYPKGLFCVVVFSCIVMGYIPAFQILLERNLIDGAIKGLANGTWQNFAPLLGQFVALMLLNALLRVTVQYENSRHNLLVAKRLDTQRVHKCNKLAFPVLESQRFHQLYEQAQKAGENDSAFFLALQTALKCSLQVVASFLVLISIDARTAIVVFAMLIPGILINKNATKSSGGFWGQYIKNMQHANYLSSLLLHREYAAERKIFSYNREIEDRYRKDCSTAIKKNSKLGQKRLFSEVLTTVFAAVYSMIAIILLALPVKEGIVSIGAFIAAFSAIANLRGVANQLYASVFDFSSSFEKLKGFFSLLDLEEEHIPQSKEEIDLEKGIEFQQVCFSYPEATEEVLQDVSFTLKMGVHYALVGENGCGKTTLVKLILGLYKPTSGRILVGGKELSKLSQDEKRQFFSVVFQDFYKYPLSIRENVSLSSTELQKDESIQRVLEALNFERAELDTNLGLLKEKSTDLSGGQWQKLAVARAILSPAQMVVLDEPNAALDPLSELAFYRVYEKNLASKTTLFISHRLGAVKTADKILVIKDKHLIAMDSHDNLMDNCQYYKQLFETQRGLYCEAE